MSEKFIVRKAEKNDIAEIQTLIKDLATYEKRPQDMTASQEDLCYWIWSGFFTFLFLYRENDGALRFYIIGSIFCSMLFYDRIISRNLRKVLKRAVRCIRMKLRR